MKNKNIKELKEEIKKTKKKLEEIKKDNKKLLKSMELEIDKIFEEILRKTIIGEDTSELKKMYKDMLKKTIFIP